MVIPVILAYPGWSLSRGWQRLTMTNLDAFRKHAPVHWPRAPSDLAPICSVQTFQCLDRGPSLPLLDRL